MREVGFEPGVFRLLGAKKIKFTLSCVRLERDLAFSLCCKNDVYRYTVQVRHANSSINKNMNT